MRDYESTSKALRCCRLTSERGCAECPFSLNSNEKCANLLPDAADAIEELLAKIDELWTQLHVEGRSLIADGMPKRGKWVEDAMRIKCSVCDTDFSDEVTCCADCYRWPWNYCPSCGAKMESEVDDNG